MMFRLLAPAALALALAANPSAAASASDQLGRHAEIVSKLIGMSPAGTKLWAEHALAGSNFGEWAEITRLEQAFGEQLSRERPDFEVLNHLVDQIAAERARLARLKQMRLLDIASRLTPDDRHVLGRFIIARTDDALDTSKRVSTPASFAWIRGIGLSEEGIKRLEERGKRQVAADDRRRLTVVERAIGTQLGSTSSSLPDLDELVTAYAAEQAGLARRGMENLASVALASSAEDRRAIGSFLAEQAAHSLAEAKPVLEFLP